MPEVFTNFATSTLAAGIGTGDLTLTVQSGDGNALFPAPTGGDFFRAALFKKTTGDVELITCTGRSADTLTIVRAQGAIGNGTPTAIAFNAGDLVELRPTAEFYDSLSVTSAQVQSGEFLYAADSGVADAYVAVMTPTAVAIVAGQGVRVKITNTNTGIAATLKLDALAAKSILMDDGSNPPAGAIKAGFVHTFVYDGTNFVFQSVGLALTSTGYNALAKQIKNVAAGTAATDAATIGGTEILTGKTLTNPVLNGALTGTGLGRGALIYNSSSLTLNTATQTEFACDSEDYDTDSIHSTTVNNTRLTVPSGVTKVRLSGKADFAFNASGTRTISFKKNGSLFYTGQPRVVLDPVQVTSATEITCSTPVLTVIAGDYFELSLFQNSGTSITVTGGSQNTWAAMEIIK